MNPKEFNDFCNLIFCYQISEDEQLVYFITKIQSLTSACPGLCLNVNVILGGQRTNWKPKNFSLDYLYSHLKNGIYRDEKERQTQRVEPKSEER